MNLNEKNEDDEMKIGDVCEKTGISSRNIHFYINKGLLKPVSNPKNHYYDFSEEDCAKLCFIREMRNAGLSVQAIHMMLNNPLTSGYYLNQHIKKLKKEQRQIEQTLISMQYIVDNMSFYPTISTLSRLSHEAGIPERINRNKLDDEFDNYNTAIVNRFLWGGFLPKTELTDYQEFLWMKVNRLSMEHPSEDYRRLGMALNAMTSEQIDALFAANIDRYNLIVSLTDETITGCVSDMIQILGEIVSSSNYVHSWKKYYENFYAPTTSIQASELSSLVMELSPFYKKYVTNIIQVCGQIYQYLHSAEGHGLLRSMEQQFGDFLHLEHANHGELEALVNVREMYHLMR